MNSLELRLPVEAVLFQDLQPNFRIKWFSGLIAERTIILSLGHAFEISIVY